MKTNLHKYDRSIRIIIGVVLVTLAFIGPQNPWFLIGLIPLITGALGFCPLYKIFHLSSCPYKEGKK